jgi:cytochrome b561
MWHNTDDRFGLASRALHWAMAVLIFALLALGLKLSNMQPGLDTLWLYGLHKSMGFVALVLVLARLIWHRISPPPHPEGDPTALPQRAARLVHGLIYACLVVIPLAGWVGSSATGIDTVIFTRITLPAIAPVSQAWETAAFALHQAAAFALIGLLALHIAGAVLRAIKGERALARMIGGS